MRAWRKMDKTGTTAGTSVSEMYEYIYTYRVVQGYLVHHIILEYTGTAVPGT